MDEKEERMVYSLPFNPLKNEKPYEDSMKNDWGIQFSHTLEKLVGRQLQARFRLMSLYEDTSGEGRLHDLNIPTFIATCIFK